MRPGPNSTPTSSAASRHVPGDKTLPDDVAPQTLAALEAGEPEVLADATARQVKQGFGANPPAMRRRAEGQGRSEINATC